MFLGGVEFFSEFERVDFFIKHSTGEDVEVFVVFIDGVGEVGFTVEDVVQRRLRIGKSEVDADVGRGEVGVDKEDFLVEFFCECSTEVDGAVGFADTSFDREDTDGLGHLYTSLSLLRNSWRRCGLLIFLGCKGCIVNRS